MRPVKPERLCRIADGRFFDPAICRDSQVALTLKTVGRFSVPELVRAFLIKSPTMAQRLVRAKRKLVEEEVELEIPTGTELPERLDAVLEVLYLMFNEGNGALEGDVSRRTARSFGFASPPATSPRPGSPGSTGARRGHGSVRHDLRRTGRRRGS